MVTESNAKLVNVCEEVNCHFVWMNACGVWNLFERQKNEKIYDHNKLEMVLLLADNNKQI